MTYAELTTRLQEWWESTEATLVSNVDVFIEYAEKRIYRSVDLDETHKEDTAAMVAGTATVTVPTGTIVILSVQLIQSNVRTFLLPKDPSFIDDYTGNRVTQGTPLYYAKSDDATILLAPTPDTSDTLAFRITYRPTQLASGQTTTWLSLNAPDLLFYSCMLELLTFQKAEQDMIQEYRGKYEQAVKEVLMEENARNRTDAYRNGEIRMNAG